MSGELEKLILGDIDVEINPSESTEERDVYNCLKTLYGSREGEQALDREFGLNMDCLSLPAVAAAAHPVVVVAQGHHAYTVLFGQFTGAVHGALCVQRTKTTMTVPAL